MEATISKFAEAVILAAVILIGIPAIAYFFRTRSPRYKSVPKFELFRVGFEIPLIVFIIIIPLSYMWFHTVRYSGIFTGALAVIGFAAFYFSIDFAQKRNRNRRQEQTRRKEDGEARQS
jgi:hypothetical protein